jgi:peptide deformylase
MSQLESQLELILYPDPRLRKVSTEVSKITPELLARCRDMFPIMYEAKGIGLAAAQVGWNVRLFLMNVTGDAEDEYVLINPVILERTGTHMMEEGCLSLPDIRGKFTRPAKLKVKAITATGKALKEVVGDDFSKVVLTEMELEAEGLVARCIQHELDHLDGILIIDKFSPAKKLSIKSKLRELEEDFADTSRAR